MAIEHRGKPSQFDENREDSYDTIHLKIPALPDGTREADPWSSLVQEVTCVGCLTALSREAERQQAAGSTVLDYAKFWNDE